MNTAAKLLVLFGVVCLLFVVYLLWQRTSPKRLSFHYDTHITKNNNTKTKIKPVGIVIPAISISLPIIPATIETNGDWQATTEGVSFLIFSPVPGEMGNAILYGHNFENLLGKLSKIEIGDKITIIYTDHSKKIFIAKYLTTVSPDEVSILKQSHDRRLTLYTCTGFLDTKRLVVTALLQ